MFKMPLSQFSIITATSIESNMIIFLDVRVSCPSVSETADKVALRQAEQQDGYVGDGAS